MNPASVVLVTCLFLWVILAIYIAWSWLTTPWYPTRIKELEELFNSKELKLPQGGKFIDIGSGEGRVVNWAASRGFNAEGIEINPYLTLIHKTKRLFNKNKNRIKVTNGNIFKHNYSDYDIVFSYMYIEFMDKLKDKLYKELKPGSYIVANSFGFSGQAPDFTWGKYKIYIVK